MAKNRKWSDADRELLISEFRKGTSYDGIAALLGRTRDQVGATIQWFRRKGIDLPERINRLDVDALNKL